MDQRIEMPIIPDFRYVGAGEPGLLMWEDRSKPLSIEIFNGSFVTNYRLAETRRDSHSDLEYVPLVEFPVDITIETKEKGGYSDTYAALNFTQGLDLQWEAEHFFLKIGVSPKTLEEVKKNLQ